MSESAPRIKTTVVGSYPVPAWLAASPSEQALMDATRTVLGTQENPGFADRGVEANQIVPTLKYSKNQRSILVRNSPDLQPMPLPFGERGFMQACSKFTSPARHQIARVRQRTLG